MPTNKIINIKIYECKVPKFTKSVMKKITFKAFSDTFKSNLTFGPLLDRISNNFPACSRLIDNIYM